MLRGVERLQLRLVLAVWAGKLAMWLSRILGRGSGSSLPGVVALRIYPGVLAQLAGQIREGIILVTGTNGKTTTSNMLADILAAEGAQVVDNRKGANLITGVTASLVRCASLSGRLTKDWAVLEVDEAAFPGVYRQVNPQIVVVTNFFRDQLDRYGELDTTVRLVRESIAGQKGVQLVLNADDPLVAGFTRVAAMVPVFYGLGPHRDTGVASTGAREARFCPQCGDELNYYYYHYSQLGDYICHRCGFARPLPDLEVVDATDDLDATGGTVVYRGVSTNLILPTGGLHNLYNAMAALTAAAVTGVSLMAGVEHLKGYSVATGRMERFVHRGRPVLLNLVKNPAGFNRGLAMMAKATGRRDVLIAINDNDADGRDVSWLWDVDFEMLRNEHSVYNCFICAGQRGGDMAVRLKYAGVPMEKILIEGDLEQAVERSLGGEGERVFMLATYTALWPVEKYLHKRAEREMPRGHDLPSVS